MSEGRFHITIVDTEHDEVCVDANADVIIGAYQDGRGTGQLCYAAADNLSIAACYTGAVSILKLLEKNNPTIGLLSKLGVMDMIADARLDEANKDWKETRIRFPHIEEDGDDES